MDKTIFYYDSNSNNFISDTVDIEFNEMQQMLLKYLPKNASILDLGCGSGRDSKVFLDNNYKVTAIDGSSKMCKAASDLLGFNVECKRFDEMDFEGLFDGIWASASLLHVPYNDLPIIFEKLRKALKSEGFIYISFKYGTFEGERNGRYFTDLNEERLEKILNQIEGLQIVESRITNDLRPGRGNERWLNVILR